MKKRVLVKFPVPSSSEFNAQCENVRCLILAKAGQHTKAIAKQLGLSAAQAQYRITKGECKGVRRDFRDGISDEAKIAVKAIAKHVVDGHVRNLKK